MLPMRLRLKWVYYLPGGADQPVLNGVRAGVWSKDRVVKMPGQIGVSSKKGTQESGPKRPRRSQFVTNRIGPPPQVALAPRFAACGGKIVLWGGTAVAHYLRNAVLR